MGLAFRSSSVKLRKFHHHPSAEKDTTKPPRFPSSLGLFNYVLSEQTELKASLKPSAAFKEEHNALP